MPWMGVNMYLRNRKFYGTRMTWSLLGGAKKEPARTTTRNGQSNVLNGNRDGMNGPGRCGAEREKFDTAGVQRDIVWQKGMVSNNPGSSLEGKFPSARVGKQTSD